MINLSYRFDQNSSSLVVAGMPDVSNGDSENTIGILSSWTLKIIGSPLLEGEKLHLENLMQVILQYSRSYISGIRKTFISNENIVTISPFGGFHKVLLKSTKKEVKPLEIILDDSELSDLTRCLDLLRFDPRFNLSWNINIDRPFSKRYIYSSGPKSKRDFNLFYAIIIFLSSSAFLLLIPINNKFELRESINKIEVPSEITE
ncbi:DUF4335 domain-containing protein [Prochlorococcus sp. MIT 0916]|uniref:DUF4335 domain-containing protein n=1 Tax=Prochlorococcus sp. MIT 0916 TaxID=3082521 RepID=UPI0039B6B774